MSYSILTYFAHFSSHSHVDLIYTFLAWSPVGLFTCLPFLEYEDKYRPVVEDRHWKYHLLNYQRSLCQKLFQILGMPYVRPEPRDVADPLYQPKKR